MALDLKRKEVELKRVEAARMELELRADEQLESINRIRESIAVQMAKEDELKAEIEKLKTNNG